MTIYLSLLKQFTVISFSCVTFVVHASFFHLLSFVWQSLSIPSSSCIKCFSVQFSTWSNLSDKLISSICSCSHLFCSCLSFCFSLDCFLFRPAAKLSSWDFPQLTFWEFLSLLLSPFFLDPMPSFGLFLHFCFPNYYCDNVYWKNSFLKFIFTLMLDCWAVERFLYRKSFSLKSLEVFPYCLASSIDVEKFDLQKLSFLHNLGDFNLFLSF